MTRKLTCQENFAIYIEKCLLTILDLQDEYDYLQSMLMYTSLDALDEEELDQSAEGSTVQKEEDRIHNESLLILKSQLKNIDHNINVLQNFFIDSWESHLNNRGRITLVNKLSKATENVFFMAKMQDIHELSEGITNFLAEWAENPNKSVSPDLSCKKQIHEVVHILLELISQKVINFTQAGDYLLEIHKWIITFSDIYKNPLMPKSQNHSSQNDDRGSYG